MDIRIEHAGRSITNFLEDILSKLPLDSGVLLHLERFRSFLHGFYVAKYGYWPPLKPKKHTQAFPKTLYTSMYFEFRKLYEYLVDPRASKANAESRLTNGPSVLQVLEDFDRRARYSPLPQCVPLSPEVPDTLCQKPQGLSKLFEKKRSRADRRIAILSALTAATNPVDLSTMDCALVREYLRFEKQCALDEDDKISCADARKVRWILIYGMLQTLISVTRAPIAVRDTEGVSYPLCCQTAGTPPWQVSRVPPKSEPQTPKLPTTVGRTKRSEEATFYYFSKTSVSFSSLKDKAITATSIPDDSTPKATQHPSRPPSRRKGDSIEDYFSLQPNRVVTKPSSAPSIALFPSASPRFSISSVTVPLRSPQPRKPSLTEAFLTLDLGESATSYTGRSHTAISSSDPSTPSTGAEESGDGDGDGWSARGSDGDAMDHHSVDDATSLYEDGDGGSGEIGGSGGTGSMQRKFSVRSDFKFDKCNPEVEQYVGSG